MVSLIIIYVFLLILFIPSLKNKSRQSYWFRYIEVMIRFGPPIYIALLLANPTVHPLISQRLSAGHSNSNWIVYPILFIFNIGVGWIWVEIQTKTKHPPKNPSAIDTLMIGWGYLLTRHTKIRYWILEPILVGIFTYLSVLTIIYLFWILGI